MAQGLNSTKTASRPSHEAIEPEADATEVGNSDRARLDHIAMEAAKRSTNRILSDEGTVPGSTIFSK